MKKILLIILLVFAVFIGFGQVSHMYNEVNVIEYGAKGDSSTDNTAAFQAAINALEPSKGGVLRIPPGNYIVNSKLLISNRNPVKFIGAGAFDNNSTAGLGSDARYGPSTIFFTSTIDTCFIVRANGTSFYDLSIYCPSTAITTTNIGIYVDSGNNFTMNRVNIMNFNTNFSITRGVFFNLYNCTFRNGHTYSARVRGYSGVDAGDSRIDHCGFYVDNNSTSGNDTLLQYESAGGLQVSHCKFIGGKIPVNVPFLGFSDFQFNHNSIENFTGGTALWVKIQPGGGLFNCHVVDNQIVASGQPPIFIFDGPIYNLVIDGNEFIGNSTDTAIYIKAGATNPVVIGPTNTYYAIGTPVVTPSTLLGGGYMTGLTLGAFKTTSNNNITIANSLSDFQPFLTGERFISNALSAAMQFNHARGTIASPSALTNLDYIGQTWYGGHDGTSNRISAAFGTYVDSAVSSGSVPQSFFIYTGKSTQQDPRGSGLLKFNIDHNGRVGIGLQQVTDTALLTVGGAFSTMNNGSKGQILSIRPMTVTNWSSSGTTTLYTGSTIDVPTLAASNAQTYTNAATFNIAGPPIAGSNVTITNPYSFNIQNGTAKFAASTSAAGSINIPAGTLPTTITSGDISNNNAVYFSNSALNRIGIGGSIADFFTDANNANTSETDLYSYTTKTNTLAANGEKLTAQFSGVFNDATATNQIRIYFAGTIIYNSTALTISGTGSWHADLTIIRTGSSTSRAIVRFIAENTTVTVPATETDLSALNFSNTNILKITGTAGGAGGGSSDITGKMGTVYWYPAANN